MCELCRERRSRLMRELQAAAARIAALGEQPQPPECQPEEFEAEEEAALRQLQEATRRLTKLRQRQQQPADLPEEPALSVGELMKQNRESRQTIKELLAQAMILLEQPWETQQSIPAELDQTECLLCDSDESV